VSTGRLDCAHRLRVLEYIVTETAQEIGRFERLLTVTVPEADLEAAKNRAARKISREVKIKGFRPGKAPRRLVEAAVGAEHVRAEAIDDVLPDVVGRALEEAELEPAVTPAVEALRDVDNGVEVDVKVTLWPTLDSVPDYSGRVIAIEHPPLDDSVVEEQIDRFREQFAELESVDRSAREGDFVSINITTNRDGEALEEVSATDLLYEVGTESLVDGLDAQLHGRSAGAIEQFDTILPERFGDLAGAAVTMQVLVKEVKEKKLPELTDEWVDETTEFDTVDELRAELVRRMEGMRRSNALNLFQAQLVDTLVADMNLELPEGLINGEMEEIFHRFGHQLGESGVEFSDYLEISGMTQEAFLDDLRQQATRSVSTDILLDSIAADAGIVVEPDEIASMYQSLANQAGEDPEQLTERFSGTAQEKRIVGDILRRKALQAAVLAAVPTDEDGNPIDLGIEEALSGESTTGESTTGEAATGDEAAGADPHEDALDRDGVDADAGGSLADEIGEDGGGDRAADASAADSPATEIDEAAKNSDENDSGEEEE
jgi:trigger factor